MSEIENKEVKTSDAKTKGRGRPAKKVDRVKQEDNERIDVKEVDEKLQLRKARPTSNSKKKNKSKKKNVNNKNNNKSKNKNKNKNKYKNKHNKNKNLNEDLEFNLILIF